MNENVNLDSTWKSKLVPRGKPHNKTNSKTTISLYVNKTLVEKARIQKLNLSRITEQALSSIIDYLETQTIKPSTNLLTEGSSQEETSRAGRSVRYDRRLRKAEVAGSNPARSTLLEHNPVSVKEGIFRSARAQQQPDQACMQIPIWQQFNAYEGEHETLLTCHSQLVVLLGKPDHTKE
jgi:hypothetical protein